MLLSGGDGVVRHGKVASSPGTVWSVPLSLYNTSFEVSLCPMVATGLKDVFRRGAVLVYVGNEAFQSEMRTSPTTRLSALCQLRVFGTNDKEVPDLLTNR